MKRQLILLAAWLSALTVQANPIIVDNGSPDYGNAYYSDLSPGIGGGIQAASSFVVGAANTLTDIHWWGGYGISSFSHAVDHFTIYLYNDSGGSPGTVAYTIPVGAPARIDTGVNLFVSLDIFSYQFDLLAPIVLPTGTTYWLSILNDTAGDPGGEWVWATSNQLAGDDQSRLLHSGSPGPWGSLHVELAYQLTGLTSSSVPDAGGTLPLLGAALFGFGLLRWRTARDA
ncbi:MAG: choice-of-anchor R domain-containing protein [Verrucomicrobiota bacterium]